MAVGKASLKRAAKAQNHEKEKASGSENNSFQSSHSKNSCFRTSRAGESSRNKARRTGKSSRIREKRPSHPLYKRASGLSSVIVCAIFSQLREICRCFALFYVKFLAIQNKLWYNLC